MSARHGLAPGTLVAMTTPTAQYMLSLGLDGPVIARVERMDSWWSKGVGVLGRRTLDAGEGLWLPDVASIHTCFVAFPLDILFLSRELEVLAVHPNVPPWRAVLRCPGAAHTIELGAQSLSGSRIQIGASVRLTRD